MIEQAVLVALSHHIGQVDKQGLPYIMHLIRVAGRCRNELEMTVAILHDAVEDTALTLESVRESFGDEVADAVDHLTWRKEQGETYDEFVERAKTNPLSAYVKTIDVIDHLRGEDAADLAPSLRKRYRSAYRALMHVSWDKVKHLPDG
jgi:(p)ppGpp synthase/HD superfamily hydrolase